MLQVKEIWFNFFDVKLPKIWSEIQIFQVKNVQHKQETRFQSSSMEDGAMKYYSASDRRPGEGVQGGGNYFYFN